MHNRHDDHRASTTQRRPRDPQLRNADRGAGNTSAIGQGNTYGYGYGDERYNESRDRPNYRSDEEDYRSVHGQRSAGGGDRGIGYGDYAPPRGQERYTGGSDYRDGGYGQDDRARMGNWRGQSDDDMLRRVGGERHHANLGHHYGHSDYAYGNADYGSRGGDGEDAYGRSLSGYTGDTGVTATGSHRGRGPKDYIRSDERIREDLSERLSDDHHIDASDISIEVKSGVVTLSGSVDSRLIKHRVENIADRCSGVKDVENRLTVKRG